MLQNAVEDIHPVVDPGQCATARSSIQHHNRVGVGVCIERLDDCNLQTNAWATPLVAMLRDVKVAAFNPGASRHFELAVTLFETGGCACL